MKRQKKHGPEVFTTTVSSKGQMVLPAPVRARLGLRAGTRIAITLQDDESGPIVLRPITSDAISRLRGSFPGVGAALDYLNSERKRDRARGR
jgi:AbrB family looped-hinge helix DNA binding protein